MGSEALSAFLLGYVKGIQTLFEFSRFADSPVTVTDQLRDELADYLHGLKHSDSQATEKDFARFTAKVEILPSGCWAWTGYTNSPGPANAHALAYGRFNFKGKLWVAHRWVWEQINGEVPEGHVLDHFLANVGECIGASCVNPDHLESVTIRENILRGKGACAQNARKTTCPKGHKYDGKDKRGFRTCSTCQADYRSKGKAESLKAVAF